jgi:hypothetical protein
MVFVVLVVIAVDLPFSHKAVPWNDDFDITAVNYGPLVLVLGLLVGIWWKLDAHKRYTGPVRTIETDELGRVIEEEPPATGAGPAGPTPAPAK